jgi:hypothetical protein
MFAKMQDRVDFLSEARRADYKEWKAKILARVDAMARGEETAESC